MDSNLIPIVWREFRVNVLNLSQAVGNFLVPTFALLFFAVAIGANFPPIRYAGGSYNYATFFLPGLIGIQAFGTMNYAYSSVRQDRISRLVALVATSRTTMADYMLGKLVGCVALVVLRSAILMAVAWLVAGSPLLSTWSAAGVFVAMLVASTTLWFGIGFTLGAFVVRESLRNVIFGIGGTVLTFASSAYYNVQVAPAWVRSVAAVNPLSFSCNCLRATLLQGPTAYSVADMVLILVLSVAALAAARAVAWRMAMEV
jgi:ABC-2 type transport system permease protein